MAEILSSDAIYVLWRAQRQDRLSILLPDTTDETPHSGSEDTIPTWPEDDVWRQVWIRWSAIALETGDYSCQIVH